MARLRFVQVMIALLIMAYAFALAVSTAHLSQLYRVYDGGLPSYVSTGLAIALEIVAFLLSIISTSLGRLAGSWAPAGATLALILVWAGNGYAMFKAAPGEPLIVTLFASCFVPVSTYIVGKVLGGLFTLAQSPELLSEPAINVPRDSSATPSATTPSAADAAPQSELTSELNGTTPAPTPALTRARPRPRQQITARPARKTSLPEQLTQHFPEPTVQTGHELPEKLTQMPMTVNEITSPARGASPTENETLEARPQPENTRNQAPLNLTITPGEERVESSPSTEELTQRQPDTTETSAASQPRRISAREVIIRYLSSAPRTAEELARLMRAPLTNIERELQLMAGELEKQGDHYQLKATRSSA